METDLKDEIVPDVDIKNYDISDNADSVGETFFSELNAACNANIKSPKETDLDKVHYVWDKGDDADDKEKLVVTLRMVVGTIDKFINDAIASKNWMVFGKKTYARDTLKVVKSTKATLIEHISEAEVVSNAGILVNAGFVMRKLVSRCAEHTFSGALKACVYSIFANVKFFGYTEDLSSVDELLPTILVDEAFVHWIAVATLGHKKYCDIVPVDDRMSEEVLRSSIGQFLKATGLRPVSEMKRDA